MAKNKCLICDKEYNYCPHCKRYESWKMYTCCAEHYQIKLILTEFREGILTALEAKNKFQNIGIRLDYDFSEFLPEITRDIKIILNTKSKPKRTTKKENN